MMKKLLFVILLTICIVMGLTACQDVPSRHAALAKETLMAVDMDAVISGLPPEDSTVSRELLLSFMSSIDFVNAKKEIQDARSGGDKNRKKIVYDLTLSYITLSRTDYTDLTTTYPQVDWAHATKDGYSKELYGYFSQALSDYLEGKKYLCQHSTIAFTFEKTGGSWQVTADQAALRSICRGFVSQVKRLFSDYRLGGDYLSVAAAERVNRAISAEARYPTVFSNTVVTKMEGHDDGSYQVTLTTVKYADLLSAVSDEVYKAYKKANPEGVYAPPDTSILVAMLEKGMLDTEHIPAMIEIVLDSESGEADYICDLISNLIENQLEIEADEMRDRIRDYLIKESINEPRTQIRMGADNPKTYVPLKIYTPAKYDSHYFKIYNAANGDLVMTIYVREGDSITAYLPEGSYTVRYATGKKWYGFEELFGPDGDYLRFKETMSLKKGKKYTITLYQNTESNLSTRVLSYADF